MRDLKIIFMGTPEFAVPSLQILIDNKYEVVAVITAPDKPKGRGQKVSVSPIKEVALKHEIPCLQPKNLKAPEFIKELKSYNANLQVVVAFRMLPEVVWDMPEYGTFNLHASLLPQYRGAAPINWAIINGEKETGVTTFLLKHEIDTGNIIFQDKEPITEEDTVGSLYERLMFKGSKLVLKTTEAIRNEEYHLKEQASNKELRKAPKIFKEDCEIDWTKKAEDLRNFIRGLSPYPGAWTTLNNKNYKIFKVEYSPEDYEIGSGEIVSDDKAFVDVQTGDDALRLIQFQPEGKRKMEVTDFLKGNKV
ncbi:MAG: methionyl-tRNA formyltransferase [Bacteroidota bacterium]